MGTKRAKRGGVEFRAGRKIKFLDESTGEVKSYFTLSSGERVEGAWGIDPAELKEELRVRSKFFRHYDDALRLSEGYREMNSTEYRVLVQMGSLVEYNGIGLVMPKEGLKEVAQRIGIGIGLLRRYVSNLEAKGYLRKVKSRPYRKRKFLIHPLFFWKGEGFRRELAIRAWDNNEDYVPEILRAAIPETPVEVKQKDKPKKQMAEIESDMDEGGLVSLGDFNSKERARHVTHDVFGTKPVPNGIACPKCGAELWDKQPNITLTSNPPKKEVKCMACEYSGYRVA